MNPDDAPSAEAEPTLAAWLADPAPLRLACGVQEYAWGERGEGALIPRLLGLRAEPGRAYAELWMGAHPSLPASVDVRAAGGGRRLTLLELIDAAPGAVLGADAVGRFGRELPFLAKVLTASRPLSIQAHPDRAQAEAGFDREEAAGVPRDAPTRNYRDRNHKPELIVALGDFFALDGFRPIAEISTAFARVPELAPLLALVPPAPPPGPSPAAGDRAWVRALFDRCMSPACAEAGAALAALLARLDAEDDGARPRSPDDPERWLLDAARRLAPGPGPDRGLYAFYLLNFVHLRAGQALFLEAGRLHAYLEGRGMEVMANSDNVLRGGLTPKWVDVPELGRVLTFASGPARVLEPRAGGRYDTPADEFDAALVTLARGGLSTRAAASPVTLLFVVVGQAIRRAGRHERAIARGQVWLVPAALGRYDLAADASSVSAPPPAGGKTTVFRVTVPPARG